MIAWSQSLSRGRAGLRVAGFLAVALCAAGALAQPAGPSAPPSVAPASDAPASPSDPLAPLAWLQGCWRGTVNQREFREQWLPPGGGMMIGASHTVMQGRTQDYEYLRLEARPDGVHYVALPSDQKDATFRLRDVSRDEPNRADIFTFSNLADGFPQRLVYRRASEGWLYAQVEGTQNGEERKVIYPMRRVDCATGELLRN